MFVSSSSTEGISLTLLEAMAVGLPIITTNVGGNPEIVTPGETGYLVPAGDSEALAEQILAHLQDKQNWEQMGRAARASVEQKFQIDRMIRDYEQLYNTLMLESWSKN